MLASFKWFVLKEVFVEEFIHPFLLSTEMNMSMNAVLYLRLVVDPCFTFK